MNQGTLPFEEILIKLKIFKLIAAIMGGIAAFTIIAVPLSLKSDQQVFISRNETIEVERAQSWKMTPLRYEYFLKHYLSSRFDWKPETFLTKKEGLQKILDPEVSQKLRESIRSYEDLAKNQAASSYYVLESYSVSNVSSKIEAQIIRIMRIQSVTVATPMTVRLELKNIAIAETSPFGLKVTGLEEFDRTSVTERNR